MDLLLFSIYLLPVTNCHLIPQLLIFGSLSSTRVGYGDRAKLAFSHLYLNEWDAQYETLPYPPSSGVYGFYTRDAFYEALGFAIKQVRYVLKIMRYLIRHYCFSTTKRRKSHSTAIPSSTHGDRLLHVLGCLNQF